MPVLFFGIANFFWWVCLYLYVPVLPVYVQLSGAPLNMVGLVLAAYSIPQVILRIPIGVWADQLLRRKPLAAAGMLFALLGALGLGLAETPWLLFLARMIVGVGAAIWVVFPIYLAAYYPPEDSGRAIGMINTIRGAALIVATAGGGFMAEVSGFRPTFFVAAFLGVLALLALMLAKEKPAVRTGSVSWGRFSSVAAQPLLIAVSMMGILFHFTSFAGVFGFIPVYAAEIGASSSDLGLITMVNLGFSTLGSLAAVWVWEKFGYRLTIICGAVLCSASLLAVPFIPAAADLRWIC